MDTLLRQLGSALGGVAADPPIAIAARVLTAYAIAVWLACALWAFVDMRRRSVHLAAPYVSAAAVILASPVLFPLVLLVHVVVRPHLPVAERRLEALRERALEAELQFTTCPVCRQVVDPNWLVCPHCRTALAHRCEQCGQTVPLEWGACAWCGASFDAPPESLSPAR